MSSIADLGAIVERIKSKAADVEIVWESEAWRASLGTSPPRHISVLDSSFNPPTLAHLSLALVSPTNAEDDKGPTSSDHIAHLLLLSVRNADKGLKPGDASLAQRLQMMILLAEEMETRLSAAAASTSNASNRRPHPVAVATIDEPTFVGKSKKLLKHFRRTYPNHNPDVVAAYAHAQMPRLTFVLGYDTLIRLFNPKYYGSHDDMTTSLHAFFHDDRSSIICARRSSEGLESTLTLANATSNGEEITFLQSSDVEPYVRTGAMLMFDIDSAEATLSSTLVRRSIASMTGTPPDLPARDWRNMVPSTVAAYITSQSLYISKG